MIVNVPNGSILESLLKLVSSSFPMRKIFFLGFVGESGLSNEVPSSVPESYGNRHLWKLSLHFPVTGLHISTFDIPRNQSGDGKIIVIRETIERSSST